MTVQTFTTSTTWTCPAGVTTVKVECWGGGGNGGTSLNLSGGTGGDYARKNSFSVTPGNNYTVHVSTGSGDDTYFDTGSLVYATAGIPPGVAGGGTTIGDVTFTGGSSTSTGKGNHGGGGGGAGASDNSNGNAGSVNSGNTGGAGGATTTGTTYNGGAGGTGGTYNTVSATNGTAPGGGGGGAYTTGSGGTGAIGQIILTYTASGNTYNETGSGGATVGSTAVPIYDGVAGYHYAAQGTFTTAIAGASSTPTLKNLSSAGRKIGNALDFTSSGKYMISNWELKCKFQSSPRSLATVELYFVKSIDGTNYETGDDSTDPTWVSFIGTFIVQANTSAQRIALKNITLPDCVFKPMIVNTAGQAFTNVDNDNILSYRTYNIARTGF